MCLYFTEEDQDVEIIGTIAVEPVKKIECEPASEKGSAIVVLGADVPGSHLRPTNWVPTNGSQKLPNIHVENRPPLGRPKMPPEGMGPDSSRPIGYVSCPPTTVSLGRPNLSTVVISSNGVRLSPDMGGDSERKRSSPLSHPTVVNRLPQMPNTSQLPPGYNPSSLPPMNSSYGIYFYFHIYIYVESAEGSLGRDDQNSYFWIRMRAALQ